MGITGLIPFLEKASKRGNIGQFSGGTVAIDAYCWLHKGAFSCADKIAMGQPTDAHVKYCMKFVHMLQANRIKPILVFDGRHLPAKKETEVKRRENRESNRRRAAELMRMGQSAEGRNLLRRSVDITHEIALELIKRCQKENVDCIVAPYEADAQLAYLNITGIADVVITEDSDLTLFGCKKIFFKMDINGNGLLVEQDRLHLAMNMRPEHFEIEKFRYMCILSGCDYLVSLPGIGLSKACKFILRNTEDDIHKALGRLGSYLNMKALVVTKEYRDAFMRALVTFKHQLVYCPLKRKQVRLHPPSPEVTEEQLSFAGEELSEDIAYQLALGNYDPFTMRELHDFDPDLAQKQNVGRTNSWHEKSPKTVVSIWSRDYKVLDEKENETTGEITKWPNTIGQIMTLNTNAIKRRTMTPKKRNFGELAEELSANEALELYGSNKMQKSNETMDDRATPPPSPRSDDVKSPISSRRSNPFVKTRNGSEISPSLVRRGKRRIKLKSFVGFRPTVIDENEVRSSKYFSPNFTTGHSGEREKNNVTELSSTVVTPTRDEKLIVEMSAKFTRETNLIEETQTQRRNEIINDRETDFIEEMRSQEEITNSSSGFFSSDPSTEEDATTDLAPEVNAIGDDEKRQTRGSDDSLRFNRSDTEYSEDVRSNDDSPSLSTKDGKRKYYLGKNNIESLRCSLFKWSNTRDNGKTNVNPSKNKPIGTAKVKTVRKMTTQRKPVDGQQSLLNMFGFQKKSVLKIVTTIEEEETNN